MQRVSQCISESTEVQPEPTLPLGLGPMVRIEPYEKKAEKYQKKKQTNPKGLPVLVYMLASKLDIFTRFGS